MPKKVVSFKELTLFCTKQKNAGKKLVLTHGCFDILQLSYIQHLQEAKEAGEILVITLFPNSCNQKNKSPEYNTAQTCAATLAALECVDKVTICSEKTLDDIFKAIKPDVFATERNKNDFLKTETGKYISVNQGECKINFLETTVNTKKEEYRSPYMDLLTPEGREFLADCSTRYRVSDFHNFFSEIKKLKVLVVGEAIIDEYQFCQTINKANKEPILAVKMVYKEKYAGGSLAIANHLSGFCDVGLLSCIGQDKSLPFIEKNLSEKVTRHFLMRENSPTIIKRRFVEEYLSQKLFETYLMKNELVCNEEEKQLLALTNDIISDYNVVIIADYGHGMMTPKVIEKITEKAKFLAVNAQTNAGNRGFNYISKYSQADYIAIDDPEARQEVRDQNSDIEDIMIKIISKIDCPRFTVTRGRLGCIILDRADKFVNVPAFAVKMIDRIGAGDAFFAFSSCFTAIGCNPELTGLIGNVAGAEACATIGNKESITPESMLAHVASLLN